MKAVFSELHDALRERLSVVADHELHDRNPQAHLERLKLAASRLDAAIAQLPAQCDRELRHYLERQSYLKALAWLDKAEAGSSGSSGVSDSSH
jgi:flagellar biosynthesis chaperone FliJ